MTAYRITGGFLAGDEGGKLSGPIEMEPIPTRQPQAGLPWFESYGVCTHPNFASKVAYENPDDWMGKLRDLGVHNMRGMFASEMKNVQRTLALAKEYGIKWLATVASLKNTDAEIKARLDDIAADPEVFCGIEGVNEPDKDGLTADEVKRVVAIQTLIWNYVTTNKLNIPVLAPALQMKATPDQYQRFADAGILGKFDVVSVHNYNQNDPPSLSALATHLDMVEQKWKCSRIWISETGYTNALASTDPRRVTEAASTAYALPNLLAFKADPRVEKVFRYEAMDDPDPGMTNNEAHFGMWRTDGSPKGEVPIMFTFLASVYDNDPDFVPEEVDLEVTAPNSVEQLLVGQSNGDVTLWLWRPDTAFDAEPVEVEVVMKVGVATVQVGGTPVGVPIQ